MKQVNFSNTGGFPLEQETLERLQTAYRSELYEAIKAHLSIETDKNYIIAHATNKTKGWAIINKDEDENPISGILYPISIGAKEDYLKATRVGTNLVYGNGQSKTAYFDFNSVYIKQTDYNNRPANPPRTDTLTEYYFDLKKFVTVKSIQAIEDALQSLESKISEEYLHLDGSKAMKGDLDLGTHKLSKLDTKLAFAANVRATDFNFGSVNLGRALVDNSDENRTDLTLNYESDWENTTIGGKVYLNKLNTNSENFEPSEPFEPSNSSLLLIDDTNQVMKSNALLNSLLSRINKLEKQTSTAVPIGMIAIWGKPAPFPEGWEEYVPLRGRMPVGFDTTLLDFNPIGKTGGSKDAVVVAHSHTITENGNVNNGLSGGEITNKIARWDRGSGTLLNGTISTEGVSGVSKNLPPYQVVHFIQYTGNPSDTTKPTIPSDLKASNIANTSITLKWNQSSDNVRVTGYLVYKDNFDTLLADLGKDTISYNVTGLSANTNYNFYVKAKDAAGNLSDPAILNTTTTNSAPVTPTVPELQHAYYGGPNMTLQWPNYIDSGDITYELYRSINGGGYVLLKKSTDTFYYDALSNGITYSYQIRINSDGYISPYSNTVTVTGNFS